MERKKESISGIGEYLNNWMGHWLIEGLVSYYSSDTPLPAVRVSDAVKPTRLPPGDAFGRYVGRIIEWDAQGPEHPSAVAIENYCVRIYVSEMNDVYPKTSLAAKAVNVRGNNSKDTCVESARAGDQAFPGHHHNPIRE